MNHDVMILHASCQIFEVLYVAADYPKTRIREVLFIVPLSTGGKIIVKRNRSHGTVRQQTIGEVTADESGPSHDEIARRLSHVVMHAPKSLQYLSIHRGNRFHKNVRGPQTLPGFPP